MRDIMNEIIEVKQMEQTIIYLKSVFGDSVKIEKFNQTDLLPMYLIQKFELSKMLISNQNANYILLKPKEKSDLKITAIKKQLEQIAKHTMCAPVLIFNALRTSQRNALIQANISFVVPYKQVFIPNVVMNLSEKEAINRDYGNEFSIAAQVVFAYLLLKDITETNAHQLVETLNYSIATLNRALTELAYRRLLKIEGRNTRKNYKRLDKKAYWEKGKKFLFNPVAKSYYVKRMQRKENMFRSNELALTRLSSMLNESTITYYAVSAETLKDIDKSEFLNQYDIFDYNYSVIEKFRYNPALLSNSNYIDIISLYAQFKNDTDERIQMELDELLEEVLC